MFKSYIILLVSLISVLPTVLHARAMVPDAPVMGFKLPRFGENTYKLWTLEGKEGNYVSSKQVDIVDMLLTTFSGDESVALETRIESPEASVWIEQSKATGSKFIVVQGKDFIIMGRNWEWDGSEKRVTINQDVRVTLMGDSLTNILGS